MEKDAKIKIKIINNDNVNKNLLRSPNINQIPDDTITYIIISKINNKYYLKNVETDMYMQFTIYMINDIWYYETFHNISNPSSYIWEPVECDITIL